MAPYHQPGQLQLPAPTTPLCRTTPHPHTTHLGRDGNAGLGVRLQLSAASQQSLAILVCLAKLPAVEGVEGSTMIRKGVRTDLRG